MGDLSTVEERGLECEKYEEERERERESEQIGGRTGVAEEDAACSNEGRRRRKPGRGRVGHWDLEGAFKG